MWREAGPALLRPDLDREEVRLLLWVRRARPAIFDRTQIRAARARIMGERFLRDAHRKPQFPEIQTEGLRRIHKGVSSRPATITPHWIQVGVIIYIITFLQIFK